MCCDLSCSSCGCCCCCYLYLIIVNMISWVSASRYCPCHVSVSLSLTHTLTHSLDVSLCTTLMLLARCVGNIQISLTWDCSFQRLNCLLPAACCLQLDRHAIPDQRQSEREKIVGDTWQARRSSAMAHNIIIIHSAEQEIAVLISKGFT